MLQCPASRSVCKAHAQLAACFSGLVAGILGLTNLPGFLLYLGTSLLSALTVGLLKCGGGDVDKYVPQSHSGMAGQNPGVPGAGGGGGGVKSWKGWLGLMGLGQENLLGFLLFWIGSYALIHGECGVGAGSALVLWGAGCDAPS